MESIEEKLKRVNCLFESGSWVYAMGYGAYTGQSDVAFGPIQERPTAMSGIWGYEGDSIAVKVDDRWFPASRVIALTGPQ